MPAPAVIQCIPRKRGSCASQFRAPNDSFGRSGGRERTSFRCEASVCKDRFKRSCRVLRPRGVIALRLIIEFANWRAASGEFSAGSGNTNANCGCKYRRKPQIIKLLNSAVGDCSLAPMSSFGTRDSRLPLRGCAPEVYYIG